MTLMSGNIVNLQPWTEGDLSLLHRLLGTPLMTTHIGGPESPEKIEERHQRYLKVAAGQSPGGVFKVMAGNDAVGWVGWWELDWRAALVYETGWSILPEFQGRGYATKGTKLLIENLRAKRTREFLHAFPSVDNGPSNAICRKLGFTLAGTCEFEYPKGRPMRANDWQLSLI